ncbi:MAG: HD-GYP domain-containing protein [Betaproteobacteria bacterium]
MIKKIAVEQVNTGMYVHDLNCDWLSHPFARKRFLLKDPADIDKIHATGIRELYIDTSRGLDVGDAPTEAEVKAEIDQRMLAAAAKSEPAPAKHSMADEMLRAKRVHEQAGRVVRTVLNDVRLGKVIQSADVESVVTDITDSVARNGGALLSLLRLKDADDYTFLHCVAVGTLMVTFARHLDLDSETIREAGIGGLMHDVGKMKVPDKVLNKPGKLTDEEFALIRQHPEAGHAILVESKAVGAIPLDITLHHHERIDGSGYPHRMPGDKIPTLVRMAAIVDVYDAITSDRCYHKGMPPTDALRKMFEWSKFHFDEALVHSFMRCIGIYPVGTLVRLASDRLGVVTDQTEGNLLAPRVRVFFSIRNNCYIKPEELDLTRTEDRIAGHELPQKWGVDPMRFLTTA